MTDMIDQINAKHRPRLHPVRERAGCTLCCTTQEVVELFPPKPGGEPCPHACAGTGCRIYADRPGECRGFACEWILDPAIPDDLKPDRCGFVVQITPNRKVMTINPDRTLTLGQWRRLVRFAGQFVARDRGVVLVCVNNMLGDRGAYRRFISTKPQCFIGHAPDLDGRPYAIFFMPVAAWHELRMSAVPPEHHTRVVLQYILENSSDLAGLSVERQLEERRRRLDAPRAADQPEL
jgi:hypothetical protein